MTLLRKLALQIADAVAYYAAPGTKDWADATAREIAFIPGDWSALAWAIGSTRVVFQRNPDPEAAPTEFTYKTFTLWVHLFGWAFWAFLGVLALVTGRSWQDRVGWTVVAFCWTYWETGSILERLRDRKTPSGRDPEGLRLFYKEGLERKLRRYRTIRRWFPLLAAILACAGFASILDMFTVDGIREHPILLASGLFGIWLQTLETPAKIQQRLVRFVERTGRADAAR